jgi:DNA-binding FadR family transcriptional regulator
MVELFQPVRTGKVSVLIMEQIRNAIRRGEMKPGDRLPSERELVERFEASRVSIREALKGLETSGLLTIQVGRGVFVAQIDSNVLSQSLSSVLSLAKGRTVDDLTEARLIFEPSVARLATERITAEEVSALEENIADVDAGIAAGLQVYEKNIEFHSLIAGASHNLSIRLTMVSLLNVVRERSVELVQENPLYTVNNFVRQAGRLHKEIVKALKKRNGQDVYDLIQKDILLVQKWLKRLNVKAEKDTRNW